MALFERVQVGKPRPTSPSPFETRRSGAQDEGTGTIARPVIARRVSDAAIHVWALRRVDRFAPLAMTEGAVAALTLVQAVLGDFRGGSDDRAARQDR
jgi:hypothetical protein